MSTWVLRGTIPGVPTGGGGGAGGGAGGWTDVYAFALELGVTDIIAAAADVLTLALDATYAETQAAQTEALEFGISGYADTQQAPTEARDSLLVRWATTTSTAGTAPTNPGNATGSVNGTTAGVKAGGLANGTSTLTCTIAAPFAEVPAGGSRTLRAYYSVTAGATDTFTVTASYRQQGQGTNTSVTLPNTGNHLAAGITVTLTNIDPSVAITVTWTHAATTPTLGGSMAVDAVGLETPGAL